MFDKYEHIIANVALVMGAAIIGRLMYHARQVQQGHRAFWSWLLALDLVIAIGMGLIAYGACVYWGLTGPVMASICALAGYLGPHAIDALFAARFLNPTNRGDKS